MENQFKTGDEFADYYQSLTQQHLTRIAAHLEHQAMWEMPLRQTSTGRTVYINNEPWTATRLIVSLLSQGTWNFHASMSPDVDVDEKERNELLSRFEQLMKAAFRQADYDNFRKRRGLLVRQWAYNAAVYGWHAGIALVNDLPKDTKRLPFFIDMWSPLDTFPDMNGRTNLAHRQRMTLWEIEKTFGKGRPNGKKIKGNTFKAPDDAKKNDMFEIVEYWDDETSGAWVNNAGDWQTLKPQMEHKLGCNPAWCNPVDGVPFRQVSTNYTGGILTTPDPESNRWLEFTGQSPMMGYKTAYRYVSELANQIADVVERWSNPVVIAKTKDGAFVELDLTKGQQNTVDLSTVLEIITPPKFPADDRAWMQFVVSDIKRGSFSDQMYGVGDIAQAAQAFQLFKQTNNYIVDPLKVDLEFTGEMIANNLATQLEAVDRNRALAKKYFPAPAVGKYGAHIYDWFDLGEFPKGVLLGCNLKGAGMQTDKLQVLGAITQAANAMHPVLSVETMLDEFLEADDPPGEVARMFWQSMTTNPKVIDTASPVLTLMDIGDKIRRKEGPRAAEVADAFKAMAIQQLQQLAQAAQGDQGKGQAPPMPNAKEFLNFKDLPPDAQSKMLADLGLQQPPQPPPSPQGGAGQGPLDGSAQQPGTAPNGAPTAGVQGVPTGPSATIGAAMAQAQQMRGQ